MRRQSEQHTRSPRSRSQCCGEYGLRDYEGVLWDQGKLAGRRQGYAIVIDGWLRVHEEIVRSVVNYRRRGLCNGGRGQPTLDGLFAASGGGGRKGAFFKATGGNAAALLPLPTARWCTWSYQRKRLIKGGWPCSGSAATAGLTAAKAARSPSEGAPATRYVRASSTSFSCGHRLAPVEHPTKASIHISAIS